MTRRVATLQPDYFESLYQSESDPWRFETSDYERDKYAATLCALSRPRYRQALEVGCSIGVLTALLAPRCDILLAVDAASKPLIEAGVRCAKYPFVSFERMFVPQQWPKGVFDLILLSEVVYYLNAADVSRLVAKVMGSTEPGSHILLVHWTEPTDYPLSGDDATDLFLENLGRQGVIERADRHSRFRLDLIVRR